MAPVSRALFAELVDDAALFPPGNALMHEALQAHASNQHGPYADLVGPFVCPASRLAELRETLPPDRSLALSVVFDEPADGAHQALGAAAADDRLELAAVEAAHERLGHDAATIGENLRRLPDTVGFLEVTRTGFADGLDLVEKGGWRAAKYRTGGTRAGAVPSTEELAAFIESCVVRGIAFKLTAGLHHAHPHVDAATGDRQHGLLNVLAAVAATVAGPDAGADPAALALEAGNDTVVEAIRGLDPDTCLRVRRTFLSFGCCGVTDPLNELIALGLLEEAA